MALEGFYTAIAVVSLAINVFLYTVIWRKADDRIKALDGPEGQQASIWIGDIWTTDVKQGVQDFFSYVSTSIADLESEDKIGELFLDTDKRPVIRKKMDDLMGVYSGYTSVRNLLGQSRKNHETIKTWLLRTIISLFSIAAWAAVGFVVDSTFLNDYSTIYWVVLLPLLIVLAVFSLKVANLYTKCCNTDNQITKEKSKHSDVLGVEL